MLEKVVRTVQVGEVVEILKERFAGYVAHVNTKRVQQREFLSDKEDPEKRVIQVDYAMGFSCEYQDEVLFL